MTARKTPEEKLCAVCSQPFTFERMMRLMAMAKRRGCELHRLHDEEGGPENDGYENGNEVIVYWLFVPDASGLLYPDQVVFDDLDEVEYDLLR